MTEELIDLAHYAPAAKNTQFLHWLASQGHDRLKPLVEQCVDWMRDKMIAARQAGTDPIPRGAPVLIVMHAPSDYMGRAPPWPRQLLGRFFRLAATIRPPLQLALELPAGHAATGAMMPGFPKFRYQRVVQRQPVRVNWR